MRGNCCAYGGCIYLEHIGEESYTPDTAAREQGVREMVKVGPSDGLSYLLTRDHPNLKGFDEYLGMITRGWGVSLDSLSSVMHETRNTPLVRMQALYLAKRDDYIRHQTRKLIPELEALARTADPAVAAYASETKKEIVAIQEWQNGEYRNIKNRAIIGTIFALGIHAGISGLFVGTSADGTATNYAQALIQFGTIKDGFSGFIGACVGLVCPPTGIPEPFDLKSDW